jgi:hypothetical protein
MRDGCLDGSIPEVDADRQAEIQKLQSPHYDGMVKRSSGATWQV